MTALNLLDPDQISARLCHKSVQLNVLEQVDSTNNYLKTVMRGNKKIIACLAETQAQGKGRLQRHWHSPFGQNIYLSLLCPFAKPMSELSGLGLVMGLAVCQAIESTTELHGKSLQVKWPNDVLLDGYKLAGILIETQVEAKGCCQVIIGVGINVNMDKAEIDQPWSSLFKTTGKYQERNILSAALIDRLIDYLELFLAQGFAAFDAQWQQRDALEGASITVLSGNNNQQGICLGVNDQGHLLLKTANEAVLALSSGDTTLLK